NPLHTYNSAGNFSVSLQVIDSNNCFDTKVFKSIKVEDRPIAGFSSSNSSKHCSAPYTVNFINTTQTNSNTSYIWDFGNGNTSTQINPSHTYTAMGSYDVTLISSTNLCSDTILLIDFVSLEPISADFSTISKQYCINDTVFFNNNSTGASNFQWSFGDGSGSNLKHPFHVYTDSGYHVVKLIST